MQGKQIIAAVAVIGNNRGEILLQKRADPDPAWAYGKWELPGGGVEFGEAPEDTVVREVKEETGMSVAVISLISKTFSFIRKDPDGNDYHLIILCYRCRVDGEAPAVAPTDAEVDEIAWLTPAQILERDCLPGIHDMARDIAFPYVST